MLVLGYIRKSTESTQHQKGNVQKDTLFQTQCNDINEYNMLCVLYIYNKYNICSILQAVLIGSFFRVYMI